MEPKDNKVILEVLHLLQEKGKAVVIGGFIRDILLGEKYKDVDILTTCSLDDLKEIFPNLSWTETGIKFGICRARYKNIDFEFSVVSDEEFETKRRNRDFTINSFYFDGKTLYTQKTADEDIENKILRPVEPFEEHLERSPNTYLRAFRFVSKYDFSFNEKLIYSLKEYKHILQTIPHPIVMREVNEIIKGEYVLKSLYYMMETKILKPNSNLLELKNKKVQTITNTIIPKLIYLDFLLKENTIEEFITIFNLPTSYQKDIEKYRDVFTNNNISYSKKEFPFILILKRYQYEDNKEKIASFLKENITKNG